MYEIHTVPFYENDLITAEVDKEHYVAMKPIVKGMGLAWQTQQRKITSSQRYHPKILPIQTKGGTQEMLCLPKSEIDRWYRSINFERSKVSSETKYQDDLARHLLAQGWIVEREKRTFLGKIDIFATSSSNILIIECKIKSCNATNALGQLLFYKHTYPKARLVFACQQFVNQDKENVFKDYNIKIISYPYELDEIIW